LRQGVLQTSAQYKEQHLAAAHSCAADLHENWLDSHQHRADSLPRAAVARHRPAGLEWSEASAALAQVGAQSCEAPQLSATSLLRAARASAASPWRVEALAPQQLERAPVAQAWVPPGVPPREELREELIQPQVAATLERPKTPGRTHEPAAVEEMARQQEAAALVRKVVLGRLR